MAYNNISKLTKSFAPKDILYADDMNVSYGKTNEIIDALNGVGPKVDSMDESVTNMQQVVTDVSTLVINLDTSVSNMEETVSILDSSVEQLSSDVSSKMNCDGSNYKGSLPLVTPTMEVTWNVYDKTKTTKKQTSTSSNLSLETGAVVDASVAWMWTARTGYKNPTRCDGTFGTTLPTTGAKIENTKADITTNSTFAQNLYAPASGLIVRNNIVVKAEGEDKTSASVSIRFKGREYFGGYYFGGNEPSITEILAGLENSGDSGTTVLAETWVNTGDGIKIKFEGSKYIYFIYPKSWGLIEKTTTDGAMTFSDWTVTEAGIINEYGETIPCYVFRTTGVKTTGTNGIVFRFYKVN